MTAPMAVNGPRLSLTADPPRRAFGAPAKPLPSLSSPGAFNGSTTPTGMSFLIPPAEPQRTLSASSSSSEALGTAANRAQAWLHTWAPKGEGRGREFLSNTLSGVAGVANTVGHGINGAVNNIGVQLSNENFGKDGREIAGMGSRQGSYTAPTSSSPTDEFSPLARAESWSPPLPMYSSSTPQLPLPDETPLPTAPLAASKRMSQPSNLSRLGSSTSSNAMYPPSPSILAVQRPSMSHPSSSTSLPSNIPRSSSISVNLALPQPHGPSHLNPNARSNSHLSAQTPSHSRSPSYGAMAPTLSRASSTTAGLSTSRSAGMPYKVGFQPAGVRNDRTGEFSEERRRYGEDRDKEEGRLGRRWAKVCLPFLTHYPLLNVT